MNELLKTNEIETLVSDYMRNEDRPITTQAILTSGKVPRLQGYIAQPGKVSDSIYGGPGSFIVSKSKAKMYYTMFDDINHSVTYLEDNVRFDFENPPLNDKDGNPIRLMVRSDRVSTHDISRGNIPFKDQVLSVNHSMMLELVKDLLGTAQYDVPGSRPTDVVIAAENCDRIDFENVLRAYMARTTTSTSLFVHYMNENRRLYAGHQMPDDLYVNGPLGVVLDSPSTKSTKDRTISRDDLFRENIVGPEDYRWINQMSTLAFIRVGDFLEGKNIRLVDTKTEHGRKTTGELVSIDELFTMDSSRYWLKDDYDHQNQLFLLGKLKELREYIVETQGLDPAKDYEKFTHNGNVVITPKSFSKEFARGFSKGEDGYTDEQRAAIAVRYIEGIQKLTEKRFNPDVRSHEERVISGLENALQLVA